VSQAVRYQAFDPYVFARVVECPAVHREGRDPPFTTAEHQCVREAGNSARSRGGVSNAVKHTHKNVVASVRMPRSHATDPFQFRNSGLAGTMLSLDVELASSAKLRVNPLSALSGAAGTPTLLPSQEDVVEEATGWHSMPRPLRCLHQDRACT
jgi:hypothetical protein